jgi:hypothetical protein
MDIASEVSSDGACVRYSPIIEFTSKEVRDRFSNFVAEALRLSNPETLE